MIMHHDALQWMNKKIKSKKKEKKKKNCNKIKCYTERSREGKKAHQGDMAMC